VATVRQHVAEAYRGSPLFVAIIITAATPNSHPDCRALLIKIVALQDSENWKMSVCDEAGLC
jgi:hypothetical protein